MNDRKDDFIKLVISEGTIDILRYLNEQGTGQYNNFMEFINVDTLHHRINQLSECNLISHHSEEEPGRDWYELTDKGRRVLQILEDIMRIAM